MREINLLFSINEKYIDQLGCLVNSILKRDCESFYNIYVMHSGIPDKSFGFSEKLKGLYNNFSFNPILVDPSLFSSLPIQRRSAGHITKETYFRFNLDALPDSVKKIIYMDVDVLVRRSIVPLWESGADIDVIGGVIDTYGDRILNTPTFIPHKIWRKKINPFPVHPHKRDLGLSDEQAYINAGILFINRAGVGPGVLNRLLDETARLSKKRVLKMQDQDVINSYFKDSVKILDRNYNYQTGMMYELGNNPIPDVCVAHFTGDIKPWNTEYDKNSRPPAFNKFVEEYLQEWEEYKRILDAC